jgi:hypothetical protein
VGGAAADDATASGDQARYNRPPDPLHSKFGIWTVGRRIFILVCIQLGALLSVSVVLFADAGIPQLFTEQFGWTARFVPALRTYEEFFQSHNLLDQWPIVFSSYLCFTILNAMFLAVMVGMFFRYVVLFMSMPKTKKSGWWFVPYFFFIVTLSNAFFFWGSSRVLLDLARGHLFSGFVFTAWAMPICDAILLLFWYMKKCTEHGIPHRI